MNALVPLGPAEHGEATALCFATIARHSRSFALASRLLPRHARAAAAVVYTWCRRADDAVDLAPSRDHAAEALARLREELRDVHEGRVPGEVTLAAFAEVVHRYRIPRAHPEDLLLGMEMDVLGHRYESMDDLLLYCYRAAGTVGLMMSHVMGVSDPAALRHASHLGIAMQLTNVARDVAEDWERGRLYLPRELLAVHGLPDLAAALGGPLPPSARDGLAGATRALLDLAGRYYASGDRGLPALHWRCALSVRTARLVYAAIGDVLTRQGCDPFAGRAVVSGGRKALLVARAAGRAALEWPRRISARHTPAPLEGRLPGGLVRL